MKSLYVMGKSVSTISWATSGTLSITNMYCIYILHLWSWWRHQMETCSALLAICAGNFPHQGQWRGALMFSLICAWMNDWVNNREAGDLRCDRAHYDVTVMWMDSLRLKIFLIKGCTAYPMIFLSKYSMQSHYVLSAYGNKYRHTYMYVQIQI